MFRNNERKEVFGLRKYKGYGLTGALIGALMFGVSGTAHANVIENNDGTTTLENGKASITLESSHVKESDKTADELYKAGEYGGEKVKSGTDEVTLKKTVDVKFVTEDGKEIDKSISNDAEKKISETYEVTGKSGKKYKGDDNVAIDVDSTVGKKDVITKDGKTYKYVRSEVEKTGGVSAKDDVKFNDVTAHATVQGMHKTDGSIDYGKIKGRVWLVEEKEDGTYGEFKLVENGVGLTDEKVVELSKSAAGVLSKAEVDKLGGIKDGDTVMVYETNTYAAVKKENTLINSQFLMWGYSDSSSYFPGYTNSNDNIDGVKKWLDTLVFPDFEKRNDKYYYKGSELIWSGVYDGRNGKKSMEWSRFYELVGDVVSSGMNNDLLDKSWMMNDEVNGFALYESYVFSLIGRQNEDDAKGVRVGTTTFRNLKSGLITDSNGRPVTDRVTDTNVDGARVDGDSFYKLMDSAYTKENLRKLLRLYKWKFKDMSVGYFDDYMKPSEIDNIKDDQLTLDAWREILGYTRDNGKYRMRKDGEFPHFSPAPMISWGYKDPYRNTLDMSVGSGNERFWEFVGEVSEFKDFKKLSDRESYGVLLSLSDTTFDDDFFLKMGEKYGKDNVERWKDIINYGWLAMYYQPYKAFLDKRENFTYHDEVTPLRAYRIGADNAVLKHVYAEVKKGSVVTNYYIENTTTKLVDSVSQGDLEVGTKYQTRSVTPVPKVEKEDLEDRTITRTTKYELVKIPDNARGNITEGETIVNYYYRPVVTEDVVMKKFKDIVTYHSETRYDVQHVFDVELEKDIKGFDNNSIFLHQKYGTKTQIARSIYDAALGFSDKEGVYPPLAKIREAENNFAKMLGYESREDYLKHNKDVVFDLVERPLFQYDYTDGTIQSDLTTGFTSLVGDLADFRTRGVFGDLDVFEKTDENTLNTYESRLPDGAELELTKITYNIDGGEEKVLPKTGFPFSRSNGTMQKGKTTHYTYHYKLKKREEVTNTENLIGSVVVKYVTTDGQDIKDAVTIQKNAPAGQRLTKSITSGTANLGSKTEVVDGVTKYDAGTVKEERIEKDGKTYVLTRVLPKDARFKNTDSVTGVVKEGLTTIVYEYKEVEKAPVTVHYYKYGTTEELAPSVDKGKSDIGSKYTTEAKVIEPKVTVEETPEKTVTKTISYVLKEIPKDKDGVVPVGGKAVNYYYVEKVDVKEVMKQAPVTVHYYKDGTTEKLADSIEKGKQDIGSKYTTEAKVIEPKVTVEETPEKTITRTVRYELKEAPKDKDGLVPVGGKVVTYYYVEKVDVKEVLKQAPVTVHYYKDGATEKLAESIEQGKKNIGSKYVTEAKVIEPKVTVEETPEKTITRTVRYELKEVPKDKDGLVPVGGKVITYYYVEKVDVKEVMKQAPVTVHYYKDGTTEKLADSIEQGKKDIGSKYITEAPRVIEEKLKDGSVRKWLLKAVPFNANGDVKAGGTTVIYYYMEFSIPKDAPVVELPEYNPPKEEPKVEISKEQPKPLEIPKPTPVEVVKEEPKVIPVVKTAEPAVQKKVLPNTGSGTTNTAGLGLGAIAVGAVMVKKRRKLGKRQM